MAAKISKNRHSRKSVDPSIMIVFMRLEVVLSHEAYAISIALLAAHILATAV